MVDVKSTLDKLVRYVEQENFQGYDPYDLETSFLPIGSFSHSLRFALTQFNKRSPVNFRPLLGIKKNYHTKGMGLFLQAYCNLYQTTKDQAFLDGAESIFSWLKANHSNFSKHVCWGFDYPYTSRKDRVDKGFPTIIHHSFILRGIYEYYKLTKDSLALEIIDKADAFIIEDLPRLNFPQGICFGYHPGAVGCCYNASMHAAQALAMICDVKGGDKKPTLIEQAVAYVISRQKPSGVWYYSHGNDPAKEKQQIDFHQGFILESLDSIDKFTQGKLTGLIRPAIRKGLEFYWAEQFDEDGKCRFRYPATHPIDIHNQAQGILTFTRFADLDGKYAEMADKVVNWTIQHMQDPKGYFYYQKYKLFTNKIPHIRWGQAWMMLALSEYLLKKGI